MTLKAADLDENLTRLETMLGQLDEEAMALSELDGFLCGLTVGPQAVPQDEWLAEVWHDDVDLAELGVDRDELVRLILQRAKTTATELGAGEYAPLYEVDDDTGEVVWQFWLLGFEAAMVLRIKPWERLLKSPPDENTARAMEILTMAMSLVEADLGDEAMSEDARKELETALADVPDALPMVAMALYDARLQKPAPVRVVSVGRNDPCTCGSGKKYKHCCGAAA